jgi:hypothetical protein
MITLSAATTAPKSEFPHSQVFKPRYWMKVGENNVTGEMAKYRHPISGLWMRTGLRGLLVARTPCERAVCPLLLPPIRRPE